jgi:hypothetical protein
MARASFGANLGTALSGGGFGSSRGGAGSVTNDAATATTNLATLATAIGTAQSSSATASGTLTTNVDNAVAALVADGANPTQGHVNTLNTAWTALKAAIATAASDAAALDSSTLSADLTAIAGDVSKSDAVLDFDASVITTFRAFKSVVDQILRTGQGALPP